MTRCIVIEDEPFARKLLVDFIARVPSLSLEGEFSSALQSLEALNSRRIDLIFLDIQMPDISGIEFLKTLEKRPNVILTTAYAEYALQGFELDVIDYLLKPFDFQRFLKAVNKIPKRTFNEPVVQGTAPAANDFIFLKDGTKLVKVKLSEIQYVKGSREYVVVHTADKKIMTLQSMKNLEEELPDYFVRVHNSFIVSIHAIQSIGKNEIEVGGENIPLGMTYKKLFFEKVNDHFGGAKI